MMKQVGLTLMCVVSLGFLMTQASATTIA